MLFAAVHDHTGIAFSAIHPDGQKEQAVWFLTNGVASYTKLGVPNRRLLTDRGSALSSKDFAKACVAPGIRHGFTQAYRPQTNRRPSDSSNRRCASGPMAGLANTQPTARKLSTSGKATTTGIAPTQVSAATFPSRDSNRQGTTA